MWPRNQVSTLHILVGALPNRKHPDRQPGRFFLIVLFCGYRLINAFEAVCSLDCRLPANNTYRRKRPYRCSQPRSLLEDSRCHVSYDNGPARRSQMRVTSCCRARRPGGFSGRGLSCEAVDLALYVPVSRTPDLLFNLESNTLVVVTTDTWQVRGGASADDRRVPRPARHCQHARGGAV